MLRHWKIVLGIGFSLLVMILIVIVNAKGLQDEASRKFKVVLDGAIVCIGEEYYTYEHHLRMEDPCNHDVYFSVSDPKRDGQLRFTIMDKGKLPVGHFLESYASWREAEEVYEKAVHLRESFRRRKDEKKE